VSLGDGWPGFARRGVAFRTSYLPFFSGPALLISAAERRSAKKRLPRRGSRTQGCSNKQLGARVLLCAALVAPVNPTLPQLILHAPRHGKRKDLIIQPAIRLVRDISGGRRDAASPAVR